MGSRLLDGSNTWSAEPNAHLFTEEQLAGVTLIFNVDLVIAMLI